MEPSLRHHHPRRATFLMHITVDTACISDLRQLVVKTCGNMLSFMRIEPVDHAERMKVWLCLPEPALRLTMDAVMRILPAAEFGRISQAQS
ncbi:hypothetical protein [Janthinobacterium agaricidamnosum]|uniref:Uncharacterized protein n=1 Tax=Janthinobacterium agaricidamnosum NBRC 102515 = DSM 9628 TaxID=1349767 RepID=W0UXT1_9BURK|nr:hypothetical protein [Janthinobacterium agaricidamnosum]CDG81359.1 conserved hypothetical protein [Janthinobacterium agaricidamnosum NBRC 102515 = DSM 9628]